MLIMAKNIRNNIDLYDRIASDEEASSCKVVPA